MIADGYLATDLMWSWWSLPRAVELSDGTVVAGGVRPAYQAVSTNDVVLWEGNDFVDSSLLRKLGEVVFDDHCTPAILAPSDKPPMVAWSKHNVDDRIRVRVGTVNEDFSSLGSESAIDVSAANDVSYAQLWREPATDNVWLLFRSPNDEWRWIKSTNYGSTWGAATTLFDMEADQGYLATVQTGSTVRCAVGFHPDSSSSTRHTVHYCSINLATGAITKADGTNIGNLSGTNLPLTASELDLVFTPTVGKTCRIFDVSVAANPEFLLAHFTDDTDADHVYVRWDGDSWETTTIAPCGDPFNTTGVQHYFGGASFPNPTSGGVIFLAREDNGFWQVEKRTSTDNGATWPITKMYGKSRSAALVRPYCPVGRSTGPEVLWCRVSAYPTYTQFVGSLAGERSHP